MATGRSSAKDMSLWVAADDSTTPLVTDLVAFVTRIGTQLGSSPVDVTAAGDSFMEYVGSIVGGSVQIAGRLNYTEGQSGGEDSQLMAWFLAQDKRQFRIHFDDGDTTNYINLVGIVSSYSQDGAHDGAWEFSATIQITGTIAETRAA